MINENNKKLYLNLSNDLNTILKDLNETGTLINEFIKKLPEGFDSTYNNIDEIKLLRRNIDNISQDLKNKYILEIDKNLAKI